MVQTDKDQIFKIYVTRTNPPYRIRIDFNAVSRHFLGKSPKEMIRIFVREKGKKISVTSINLRMPVARCFASLALVMGLGILR